VLFLLLSLADALLLQGSVELLGRARDLSRAAQPFDIAFSLAGELRKLSVRQGVLEAQGHGRAGRASSF